MSFVARAHPQQVDRPDPAQPTFDGLEPEPFDLDVDDRATTPEDFAKFDSRWHFTLDVAAAAHNTKCARYYSVEDDGLSYTWAGERVWCNPPYSNIRPWLEKAWHEAAQTPNGYSPTGAHLIVMLLPANRTEQGWWQDLVEPFRDTSRYLRTEFLPGRMRFLAKGQQRIGANERPPFGCVLLIWGDAAA